MACRVATMRFCSCGAWIRRSSANAKLIGMAVSLKQDVGVPQTVVGGGGAPSRPDLAGAV